MAPFIEIPNPVPLRINAPFPVLESVMVCASAVVPTVVLAKVKLDGDDRPTTGAVPVPLKTAVCDDPLALSAMLTAAFNVPEAVGLKVTLIAQLTPADTLVPQVLV